MKKLFLTVVFVLGFALQGWCANIIEEGWETATGWSVTQNGGTIDEASTTQYRGSRGSGLEAIVTGGNSVAMVKKTFSTAAQIMYVSCWIYPSATNLEASQKEVLQLKSTAGTTVAQIKLRQNGGAFQWQFSVFTNGNMGAYNQATTVTLGQWYLLGIAYDITNMTYAYMVNGTVIASGSLTGTVREDINSLILGFFNSGIAFTGTLYFDNLVVTDLGFAWQNVAKENLPVNDSTLSNWDIFGGSTPEDVLTDDSDDTYLYTETPSAYELILVTDPTTDTDYPISFRAIGKVVGTTAHHKNNMKIWNSGGSVSYSTAFSSTADYIIMEALTDPGGGAWVWSDIDGTAIIFEAKSAADSGGRVLEAWADVLYGFPGAAVLTDPPYFGGTLNDEIKCHVRVDQEAYVALRYGTNQSDVRDNTGTTTTTAYQLVTSATNFSYIFELTGLTADTTYYFDVIIGGQSWAGVEGSGDIIWSTLPNCKTLQADSSNSSFSFIGVSDRHNVNFTDTNVDAYRSIANLNPEFILDLGDLDNFHTDDQTTLRADQLSLRGYGRPNTFYTNHVMLRFPQEYTWSDHDCYTGDNGSKYGGAGSDWGNNYVAYNAVIENFPMIDLVDEDITGAATGGSATTLVDSGEDFSTTVFPGMVVYHTVLGNIGGAIVQSVSTDTITFTAALTDSQSFASGDTYHIKAGGLYRSWNVGTLAKFIMIDSRYKRDPNGTADGDLLDGRLHGAGTGADDGDGAATGHLQRDWLVAQVTNATERWIFIVSDIPIKYDTSADRLGAYDPNDAIREYIKANCLRDNVIWIGGDIHDGALDDAQSHADDFFPSVSVGNLGGGPQDQGDWYVNGVESQWTNEDGAYFAHITVSEKSVSAQILNENGTVQGIMNLAGDTITVTLDDSDYTPTGATLETGDTLKIKGAGAHVDLSGLDSGGKITVKLYGEINQFTPNGADTLIENVGGNKLIHIRGGIGIR